MNSTDPYLSQAIDKICQSCALCCDGTLFARIKLSREEIVITSGLCLPQTKGKKHQLDQPCPALLSDGNCGIYPDRPKACRAFYCKLVRRFIRGKITADKALAVINHFGGQFARKQNLKQSDPISGFKKADVW